MAGTRFEYVRAFERTHDELLPNAWIVVRVDGNGFSDFVKTHSWLKPMDQRGVNLMVACAQVIMGEQEKSRACIVGCASLGAHGLVRDAEDEGSCYFLWPRPHALRADLT